MYSTEDLAAIKIAMDISNHRELIEEVLQAPGTRDNGGTDYHKLKWDKKIESRASNFLELLDLRNPHLREKVLGFVYLIAKRMRMFSEYHEGILDTERSFSVNFLNSSLLTSRGVIDEDKVAKELLKNESLSVTDKYKLACFYCIEDEIYGLYEQMTESEKNHLFYYKQPGLVEFWSYYITYKMELLLVEDTSIDDCMLERVIRSGSKAAVEYFFEHPEISNGEEAIQYAAIEAVRNRVKGCTNDAPTDFSNYDWSAFKFIIWIEENDESWLPRDYFVDILCYLLRKMTEKQRVEFLKIDLQGIYYEESAVEHVQYSRVLGFFLTWPFQEYFMETANLMWEFLPEWNFVDLLEKICGKIEPEKGTYGFGEEKTYSYRKLLKEFWSNSPQRFKSYAFAVELTNKNCKEVLLKLMLLTNFTIEDKNNFEQILDSISVEEKTNFIRSTVAEELCVRLMQEEKWRRLDVFAINFFSTTEQFLSFKKEFSFRKQAQCICLKFAEEQKWSATEMYIKWSTLSLDKVIKLKYKMLLSDESLKICADYVANCNLKQTINYCERFSSSKEELRNFKDKFIFSSYGIEAIRILIFSGKMEHVYKFVKWAISSKVDSIRLKRTLVNQLSSTICKYLIAGCEYEDVLDNYGSPFDLGILCRTIKFNGGKWEEVEMFLTWCFQWEVEITDFKKSLFDTVATEIHFNLINASKWVEAEIFVSWLGLPPHKIIILKKLTLFEHSNEIYESIFDDCKWYLEGVKGGKWGKIELFIRWCLMDKESIREFRNEINNREFAFQSERQSNYDDRNADLCRFNSVVEDLLVELG